MAEWCGVRVGIIEWTNVDKATLLLRGHLQPTLTVALCFYEDLLVQIGPGAPFVRQPQERAKPVG